MQVDLGVALIVAVQVGTTTALTVILRGIVARLDKQNNRIEKTEDRIIKHIEESH